MSKQEKILIEKWERTAKNILVGKTIQSVRYLTDEEQEAFGWSRKTLVIEFDLGYYIFAMADDEGNEAGALRGGNYLLESNPETKDNATFQIPVI